MADYIPALVIRKNYIDNINDPGIIPVASSTDITMGGIGITENVECPGLMGGIIEGDFWAKPVNDTIGPNSFVFIPYNLTEPISSKPNGQSFPVVRIGNRKSSDTRYILGTSAQFNASCAICCGAAAVLMPVAHDLPSMEPCQVACKFDADSKYHLMFGLPVLTGNKKYYAYGHFNGKLLPLGTATGYTTIAALLAFLNTATTGAGTAASPYAGGWAVVGTWSNPGGNALKVVQTAGPGTDEVCASVIAIDPSI